MQRTTLFKVIAAQTVLVVILAVVIVLLVRRGDNPGPKTEGTSGGTASRTMGAGGPPRGGRNTNDDEDRGATSIPVKVAKVLRRSIDASLWDSTWLEPETRVDVLTKSSGEIVKLNVEEGDAVKEGDVLAEIESDKPQVEYRKAQVDVDNAKVTLHNSELSLGKAKLSYDNCKQLYARAEKMWKQRVLSAEEYDTKKLNCETAEAEYNKAKLDMDAAKLKVSTAEFEMQTAKLNLEYTKILSPIAGMVTIRGVERGQIVNTNYAAFSVADYDPIIARISVPETELSKIRIGGLVRVEAESMPGKELEGKVRLISPIAETGKVKVEVQIPNANGVMLRPGMYATVHLVTETRENALVIPKRALVIESDANEVFIAQEVVQVNVPRDQAEGFKVDARVRIAQTVAPEADTKEKANPGSKDKADGGAKGKADGESKDKAAPKGDKGEPIEKLIEGKVANVLPPGEEEQTAEVTVVLPDGHGLKKGAPAKLSLVADGEGKAVDVEIAELGLSTRAAKRRVDLGLSERNDVEVTKGLNEGERVVTAGNEELKNGSALLVMAEETPQGETKIASAPPKPAAPRGRWGGGEPSPEFMERMKERVLADPKVKAEFDKRVKEDPSLNTDPKKFFAFVGEMREKGLIQWRRGGGRRE